MSTKYVSDTKAGKSISAYIILNKKGKEVATVRAHYSDGGNVLVNIFQSSETHGFQAGSAGGYGYDKFTAALSGLQIDGHKLTNHCGESKKMPKGGFRAAKPPRGWMFNNRALFTDRKTLATDTERDEWEEKIGRFHNHNLPPGWYYAPTSCYRNEGMNYLRSFGYRILKAI
jgi:hypothetical protein